jgi:O-antigen/teichoic acid export membrane protein
MVKGTEIKKIARGAGILLLNGFVLYAIRFIYRIITSRYLGPEDYGLLSLGVMVAGMFAFLSPIGTNTGITKFVAHYNGLKDKERIKGTIISVLKISFIISIIASMILILFSSSIAVNIFHNISFKPILIVFAISIPFWTLIQIVGKTLIAFKKPEYMVISSTFGRELSLLLIVGSIILFGGTLIHISIAFIIALIIGVVIGFFLLEKKVFPLIRGKIKYVTQYKELISFSFPLFLSTFFINIMSWIDTFFLGYFTNLTSVGIYNVALPLASSIVLFLGSFSKMFFPIISEIHAKKSEEDVSKIFIVIARWIFMLSFPIFIFFILFPKSIINLFFGHAYLEGHMALVILVIGYFVQVITGPSIEVLKTYEKVKIIFYINTSVAIMNVVLNIVLIPIYGMLGAAISTSLALVVRELFIVYHVKRLIGFKYPFPLYIKYFISGIVPIPLVFIVFNLTKILHPLLQMIILFCMFFTLYIGLLLIQKGLTKDDKIILLAVENKFGLKLGFVKKLLNKLI